MKTTAMVVTIPLPAIEAEPNWPVVAGNGNQAYNHLLGYTQSKQVGSP